ncbi:hypothetical protein FRC02_003111 [Tulasnella sp. 418]|nr:hypothetical protein FRC02_003111 [Tulasnella sp. 418]
MHVHICSARISVMRVMKDIPVFSAKFSGNGNFTHVNPHASCRPSPPLSQPHIRSTSFLKSARPTCIVDRNNCLNCYFIAGRESVKELHSAFTTCFLPLSALDRLLLTAQNLSIQCHTRQASP